MKTLATKVVFRKWPDGTISALFPEVPADVNGLYCTSYERIGQHGSADAQGVVMQTALAKPDEYASLATELRRIGYVLDIRARVSGNAYQIRRAEIERTRKAV